MGLFLTQLFIALSLLTPVAFGLEPDIPLVMGTAIVTMLVSFFYLPGSRALRVQQPYLMVWWTFVACMSILPVYVTGAAQAFRGLFPYMVASFLIMVTPQRVGSLKWLGATLGAVSAFVTTQALLQLHAGVVGQYVLVERVAQNAQDADAIGRIRGLGTINDPNDFGQLLACTIPLLWLMWKRGSPVRNLFCCILPAAYLMVGIYFTRSRGTTVALVVLLIFAFKDKLGLVASSVTGIGATAGMVALGLTGGRGMSEDDGSRIGLWAQSLGVFKQHPLTGIGLGTLSDHTDTSQTAHNSFVLSFTETGIIGYFFFIMLLLSCWMTLTRLIGSYAKKKSAQGGEAKPPTMPWSRPAIPMPALAAGPAQANPLYVQKSVARPVPYTQIRAAAAGASANAQANAEIEAPLSLGLEETAAVQEMEHAAFCVRLSFVTFLASGMFLSRTYSLIFYALVGMTGALAALAPAKATPPMSDLLKRVPLWLVGSIVFIYLLVRLHGGR